MSKNRHLGRRHLVVLMLTLCYTTSFIIRVSFPLTLIQMVHTHGKYSLTTIVNVLLISLYSSSLLFFHKPLKLKSMDHPHAMATRVKNFWKVSLL